MDGNFGLVHKANSGQSYEAPQVAKCVFLSQPSVDNFVNTHNTNSKKGGGVSRMLIISQSNVLDVYYFLWHLSHPSICQIPMPVIVKAIQIVVIEKIIIKFTTILILFCTNSKSVTIYLYKNLYVKQHINSSMNDRSSCKAYMSTHIQYR